MKYLLTLILTLGMVFRAGAVNDHYENGGLLYVVVACVAVILIGVALFLFYLERRITKLEDNLDDD